MCVNSYRCKFKKPWDIECITPFLCLRQQLHSTSLRRFKHVNPLTFWKENERKFPVLAKLAREFFGVPSSSSPVERLFSIAGKVFTPDRCRLKDNRFEQLMFIRCNNTETD